MGKQRSILWFRNDLRLHDNEALSQAVKSSDKIIPLYVFDDRLFKNKTPFGFDKTGIHRAKFIIESVHDLRDTLRELGSELYVRSGITEDIIFSIARKNRCSYTFCNRERTREEVEVQDELEQKLWTVGQEVRYSRGKMLYYTADLPFPINHTPDQFSVFRKDTERLIPIRDLIPIESGLEDKTYKDIDPGDIPALDDFNLDYRNFVQSSYNGGEMNAMKRLNYFLWEKESIKEFKNNQFNMIGDCSSMLSHYLAQGCLSPKKIYHELKSYEKQRGGQSSINELFHHLMYRDFLRLMAKKYGDVIFQYHGIRGRNPVDKNSDRDAFNLWKNGQTGNHFVDANMIQLMKTGHISFKGRETVASHLVHELGVNWKMGAEYFESMLLDYDPCSNWVNWNNVVGIGSESKDHINSVTAGKRYDPSGEFVKTWLN